MTWVKEITEVIKDRERENYWRDKRSWLTKYGIRQRLEDPRLVIASKNKSRRIRRKEHGSLKVYFILIIYDLSLCIYHNIISVNPLN